LHRHRHRSVCPTSPSLRVLDIAVDSSARVTVEVPDHSSFEISNAGCFSAFRSLKLWGHVTNEVVGLRHEQESYWNNEHRLAYTSEIRTASEGDRYEKSVIFPLLSLISLQLGCIFHEKFDMWSNSSVAILYCSRVLVQKELGRQTMPALCEEAQDQRSSRRFSQGHINNTYANASQRDPKILMTTTWDPSAPLIQFAKVGLAFFLTYHIIQISFAALLCMMFCDATWQPILRNDSRIILLCNICFRISTLDVH
ncbi:hypothetical protein DVH24_032369, partial [Malus domestica]